MAYGSKPDKTVSLDETIKGFSGQNNPIEKRQQDINPTPHSFNKANNVPRRQGGGGYHA